MRRSPVLALATALATLAAAAPALADFHVRTRGRR